jgi:hypothetical protein
VISAAKALSRMLVPLRVGAGSTTVKLCALPVSTVSASAPNVIWDVVLPIVVLIGASRMTFQLPVKTSTLIVGARKIMPSLRCRTCFPPEMKSQARLAPCRCAC